ncbi:MAG TPA: DUF2474 domain-containing protein [Lautropia sp.]|jgi:hypothetical protein|nr:DUF2474 domain-containing protein [Lautropia sp.]
MSSAQQRPNTRLWGRRIAWLVAIWFLSVGALALVAFALKGIMRLVGMTS